MTLRATVFLVIVTAVAAVVWREQLFTVQKPGEQPRPLMLLEASNREPARLDVVLPAVPTGMRRLRDGDGVLVIHYWAPWERDGRAQATALDSLRRAPGLEAVHVVLVCFDPFPSVSRYVARNRLRLSVLLDSRHELRAALPCPSIPYTYVVDRDGRVAAAQEGEIDWLAPRTIESLRGLNHEPAPRSTPAAITS